MLLHTYVALLCFPQGFCSLDGIPCAGVLQEPLVMFYSFCRLLTYTVSFGLPP